MILFCAYLRHRINDADWEAFDIWEMFYLCIGSMVCCEGSSTSPLVKLLRQLLFLYKTFYSSCRFYRWIQFSVRVSGKRLLPVIRCINLIASRVILWLIQNAAKKSPKLEKKKFAKEFVSQKFKLLNFAK